MLDLATALVQHATSGQLHPLAGKNPFDGITPDFSIFGAQFNTWWKKLLSAAWAAALIFCAFKLFPAAMSVHRSRKVGNAVTLGEATQDIQFWGVTTGVTVAAGLVFGTLLLLAG
jgi:hypothetical protein